MNDHRSPKAAITRAAQTPLPRLKPAINVRSTSLTVLAILATIGFLYIARAVFIPITIAVLGSYTLTPVVDWLKRRVGLAKPLGAALTVIVLLGGLGFALTAAQPEAIHVLEIVPRAVEKLSAALRPKALGQPSAVEKMKKAATEIEKAANAVAATPSETAKSTAPAPVPPPDNAAFNAREYLVMGTANAIAGAGQLVVIVSLLYFLLITGDSFRRTLVRVSGDTLSQKKITVEILDRIDFQIQRYLLVQVATSALLGVLAWAVFAWFRLDNALFWAVVGGILHLVPYVGPITFVAVVAVVTYVEVSNLQTTVLIIGIIVTLIGVIGLLLVPLLTQQVGRLKAVTVFATLLFWGWLWGVWGLLLGVPIVMAINAICERVEGLQPIAEFLGYTPRKAGSDPKQRPFDPPQAP